MLVTGKLRRQGGFSPAPAPALVPLSDLMTGLGFPVRGRGRAPWPAGVRVSGLGSWGGSMVGGLKGASGGGSRHDGVVAGGGG